ncbi:hypothetical protein KP509_38G017200 [Ceratopteris richardii]|uniref:Protein kinase domain-containing protein n=1 Tax=Ceratopteris richardii TaxID=49495 RepID=A0A8T2Q261_CERRI|nr:hypothetical protein KP509_38G017200 [Ceratopteris richardii]
MWNLPNNPSLCFMIRSLIFVNCSALVFSQQLQQLHTENQQSSASASPLAGLETPKAENDAKHGSHLQKRAVVGIIVSISSLGCILLGLLLLWFFRGYILRKPHPQPYPSQDGQKWRRALKLLHSNLPREKGSGSSTIALEYKFLKAITDNFSTNNLLGSGGSGSVYKACLDENIYAAVKVLKNYPAARQQFQTEIAVMSKIRHQNLVTLLGYSIHKGADRTDYLLVYEMMLNGSLEDQLHGSSRGAGLNWDLRVKVALEAARGLNHLHEECSPPIIHRDFKSSNILLDSSFDAKISDFGLAIKISDNLNDKSAELQGTLGYVAPEYLLDGIISEKTDVYAFGVVLLELITGHKSIDRSMPVGLQSLVTWAAPLLKERNKLMELLDPKLQRESIDLKHLQQFAAIATLCIQTEPSYRPLMKDVVSSLMPLVPLELGGARRISSSDAKHRMIMMKTMCEVPSSTCTSPWRTKEDPFKSKSFSEYSSIPIAEYAVDRFAISERLHTGDWHHNSLEA